MDKEGFEVKEFFSQTVAKNEDLSVGVVAIMTLMKVIEKYKDTTIQGLDENLKDAILTIKTSDYPVTAINSGCELFMRFITFAKLDYKNFEHCREVMLDRGHIFLDKLQQCRDKIVKLATKFIADGSKVLTHSRSRVVLKTLIQAFRQQTQFEVFVWLPDGRSWVNSSSMSELGIVCAVSQDGSAATVICSGNFRSRPSQCSVG
jgi:translation initiation factor eIF-2B subunit alpha